MFSYFLKKKPIYVVSRIEIYKQNISVRVLWLIIMNMHYCPLLTYKKTKDNEKAII